MAKKKVNTKVLTWLNGPFRLALGPAPNTLAPLNIIAFFVPHIHSDAAMQILHWYTTLGFCFVFYLSQVFLALKSMLQDLERPLLSEAKKRLNKLKQLIMCPLLL